MTDQRWAMALFRVSYPEANICPRCAKPLLGGMGRAISISFRHKPSKASS